MIKSLRIIFSNGEVYDIPAKLVAANRAKYYSEVDFKDNQNIPLKDLYDKEVTYALSNGGELIDWAQNNMNWMDVVTKALKVDKIYKTIDRQSEWCNNELECIE